MYNQIAANKRKTALLILIFIIIVLALGWILGELYGRGSGIGGLFVAMVLSFILALGGYFHGDRIALAASGARPVQKTENPYLVRLVENLAITAGIPTPKIHLIHDPAINAFATGRDPQHASIAVTTGAILKLANEELEGVLAHELSHIKNYDIRVMTLVIVLAGMVVLIADWFFRAHLYGGRDRGRGSHPAIFLIAIVSIILAPLVAQLIKLAVSRKREYLADASGALLTRFPEGLARALEKIAAQPKPMARANHATAHLFIANPFGERVGRATSRLFSTHPPIEERVRALRQMGI